MDFLETLRSAMDTTDQFAYIDRVKSVVRDQLLALDPSIQVEDTKYFNHSAVPDFIASWPGERGQRRVYLRDSYDSIVAGQDGVFLTDGDPVLVSLEEAELDIGRRSEPATEIETPTRMLVTDVDAMDLIAEASEGGDEPLVEMVRANFVRGARGHVDRPVAETLVGLTPNDAESLRARRDSITESFFPDAAFRISRTAALMEFAAASDAVSDERFSAALEGRLSLTEMRTVLPWILRNGSTAGDSPFWRRLGSLMSFAELERVRDVLEGLDLTHLVEANADYWEARWGYIGLSTPIVGDDDVERRREYWTFLRGSLGFDYQDHRLLIASNGQLMPKSREGRGSADWNDLESALVGRRLGRVGLTGVSRSIAVTAEQSPDIRADINEITESVSDSYRVSDLVVRVPSALPDGGLVNVELNFETATTSAGLGASIAEVATVTIALMDRSRLQDAAGVTSVIRATLGDQSEDSD